MNPTHELNIENLFVKDEDKAIIKNALNLRSGLIIFSGSTGSGKTTSLYTCLRHISDQKIYTIEDPIEFHFDFLIQLEVNPLIHFTFDEAIKQVLRHDPNVIVIGEIRDEKEAKAAIRSALSGHLVLTTIHANNAQSTLTRMKEFGISDLYLEQTIKLIVYQELIHDPYTQKRTAHFELHQTA
jgi:competence protein ComGA